MHYCINSIKFRFLLFTLICFIMTTSHNICISESAKTTHNVFIVSGHVSKPVSNIDNMGAKSYSGIFEYQFNDAIVRYFENKHHHIPDIQYHAILASRNMGLRERVEYANEITPDLYIEIHHDSAQLDDIKKASQAGEGSPLWNEMRGFSVHYSENNLFPEKSRIFAQLLADEMLKDDFKPNIYHVDKEGMICVDRKIGIYNRISPWGLYVLNNMKSPSVVIECGNIINPHEEILLSLDDTRIRIVNAINSAINRFFELK